MTTSAAPDCTLRARLRLLATTDLHMHLTAYDYSADQRTPGGSLSRISTLIRQARAEAQAQGSAVLMLDNGDGLQGTPMGDLAAEHPQQPHPLMKCFEGIGYDAIGLGNHDFNFGLDTLEAALLHAPCPVLSTNLTCISVTALPMVRPHAILERRLPGAGPEQKLRIGLLSFLPPQTALWDAHLLKGQIQVDDILSSAAKGIANLSRQGCDLIIALAHSGLGKETAEPGMENAVIPLAALPGIDAIIAGHTHQTLPGPDHDGFPATDAQSGTVHGKPVLMPGSAGSHLGVADLDLQHTADGWTVTGTRTALRPVTGVTPRGEPKAITPEDPALCDLLAGDHAATVAGLSRLAGSSSNALHTFFSLFAPDRALALMAAAQAAALRPMLAGTAAEHLAMLSATSPAKCGGRAGPLHYTDIPAGPLRTRHLADLCAFPNDLSAVILRGRDLRDWLEMSASLFTRIAPGSQGTPLTDPLFPAHNFDVLHGLDYRIDLSQPARYRADGAAQPQGGTRISSVRWNGQPLDPDQRFVVALNSYRAAGGGNVAALHGAQQIPLPPIRVSDVLFDYLSAAFPGGSAGEFSGGSAGDPLQTQRPVWRFAPVPGASALVMTGPGARAHLSELDGRGITIDGYSDTGFLRLTLPLDRP